MSGAGEDEDESLSVVRRLFEERARRYSLEASSIWQSALIDPLIYGVRGTDLVLDLCCGPGPVGRRILATRGDAKVVSGDITMSFLRELPREMRPICLDAHRLPFAQRSFDAVVIRQGLHYCNPEAVIQEMLRVALRHVAVGNVVMDEPSDTPFWRGYSSIVTPGRSVFFARGEVPRMLTRRGAEHVWVHYEWGEGRVEGSVSHLAPEDQEKARDVFRRQPTDIANRYRIRLSKAGILYRVPWEFAVADVSS